MPRRRIDAVAITVHPNPQRITGFDGAIEGEAAGVFGAVDLPSGVHPRRRVVVDSENDCAVVTTPS